MTALARRFVLLSVDERYSSQKAPSTHEQIALATASDIGRPVRARNRLYVISGTLVPGRHKLMLDRDVSASLNLVVLGLLKLLRGELSAHFETPVVPAARAAAGGRGGRGRGRGGRGRRGGGGGGRQRAAAGAVGGRDGLRSRLSRNS